MAKTMFCCHQSFYFPYDFRVTGLSKVSTVKQFLLKLHTQVNAFTCDFTMVTICAI